MLTPWKESYDKPRQCIINTKQKHHFADKGPYSQSYGFFSSQAQIWTLYLLYESWVFELWCWRKLLRVPWTARRSNQSVLKEISPEYSFEGLMLKLKLQYFGHLTQRSDSLEKTLMLGKFEVGRRSGQDGWMELLTWCTWVWSSSQIWWWTGKLDVL